jgi:hypothetical protein
LDYDISFNDLIQSIRAMIRLTTQVHAADEAVPYIKNTDREHILVDFDISFNDLIQSVRAMIRLTPQV